MAIHSDVLIIGGGLAGTIAAIKAARSGVDVRLVSHKKSTLRQASGLIDALGYVPAGETDAAADAESGPNSASLRGPVVNPTDAIEYLNDDHPYALVGPESLHEGLHLFDELVGDMYLGTHTDRNALVPTFGGTVKPTARYPQSVAAGLASDERPMVIVGFRSLSEYDARAIASRLEAAGVPFTVSGIEVEFAEAFRDDAKITRFARVLDENEPIDGTPAREALAEAVEPHLSSAVGDGGLSDGQTQEFQSQSLRVGFPAFLGVDNHRSVRESLETALAADVFELPMGPPSLPGLRLEDRFESELSTAGVRLETGVRVMDYTATDGGSVESVVVDRTGSEVPYSADAFVLATGGLVGKGINSDRSHVVEPIFDCHVPHPADRYDWFVDDAFGAHPFAQFGVRPDERLRPQDAQGTPEFSNLFAAGSVVGGADVAREKSASGVSLATGVVAGTEAAKAASTGEQ